MTQTLKVAEILIDLQRMVDREKYYHEPVDPREIESLTAELGEWFSDFTAYCPHCLEDFSCACNEVKYDLRTKH